MLPSHYKECFLFAWFPVLLLAHSDTILTPVLVLNLVLLSGRSQDNFFSPTVMKFHCDCPSVVFFFFFFIYYMSPLIWRLVSFISGNISYFRSLDILSLYFLY